METTTAILADTATRIRRQGVLPLSPGRYVGSSLELCAGACLVQAALARARGEGAAAEFGPELLRRGKPYLLEAANDLGLDLDLVRAVIAENDVLPEAGRAAAMLARMVPESARAQV